MKAGRRKLPAGVAKAHVVCARFTDAEHAAIERAAEANDMSPSEWARRVLLAAAYSSS